MSDSSGGWGGSCFFDYVLTKILQLKNKTALCWTKYTMHMYTTNTSVISKFEQIYNSADLSIIPALKDVLKFVLQDNWIDPQLAFAPYNTPVEKNNQPHTPHLSATLASTTVFGGTFHGQFIRPPGNLLKSNWQQIFGSGPQV